MSEETNGRDLAAGAEAARSKRQSSQRHLVEYEPARLTVADRIELAAALLTQHVGERPYRIAGRLMNRLGCSRRTAVRLLARAREALIRERQDSLKGIASDLPLAVADVVARARKQGSLRMELNALALLAQLTKDALPEDAPATPTHIVFQVVEPTGTPIPSPDPAFGELALSADTPLP